MPLRYPVRLTALFILTRLMVPVCIWALPALSNATDDSGYVQTQAEAPRGIVVLGDSISAAYGIQREQGWVHLLGETLKRDETGWQAVNASVSGETTGGALARLPGVLSDHEPDIVIIELGGNDGLRGYPVQRMRDNLVSIVERVTAAGAVPVIMGMRIPPNYGPRYTRDFEGAFAEVAESTGALYIPFFLADVALEDGMMQRDGIHPTAPAQPRMLAFVLPYLEPLLD